MQRVESLGDLLNFLSVVVVSAPDRFRKFDFLADEDQMDLSKAFAELEHGMIFVAEKIKDPQMLGRLRGILAASLHAYQSGDQIRGAHLLQDFEQIVFPDEG